jgi:hypothetical protein
MPVSDSHRFIFIHVPKAAGTSVTVALNQAGVRLGLNGPLDFPQMVEHRSDREFLKATLRKSYSINNFGQFPVAHLPATIVRELVLPQVWSSYFKFTFVRNPWDAAVSAFHYLKPMMKDPDFRKLEPGYAALFDDRDFTDYVKTLPSFFSDQSSMICDEQGRFLVDFVGKYENIVDDFAQVAKHIGISPTLPRANVSEHADYRQYYTPETQEILRRHYARDIANFGYEF